MERELYIKVKADLDNRSRKYKNDTVLTHRILSSSRHKHADNTLLNDQLAPAGAPFLLVVP